MDDDDKEEEEKNAYNVTEQNWNTHDGIFLTVFEFKYYMHRCIYKCIHKLWLYFMSAMPFRYNNTFIRLLYIFSFLPFFQSCSSTSKNMPYIISNTICTKKRNTTWNYILIMKHTFSTMPNKKIKTIF